MVHWLVGEQVLWACLVLSLLDWLSWILKTDSKSVWLSESERFRPTDDGRTREIVAQHR